MNIIEIILLIISAALVLLSLCIFFRAGQKYRAVKELLKVDSLTGQDSYTVFCLKLRSRLRKDSGPWAFAVMDLDQFKLVNDIFGREAGDQVLRYIDEVWRKKLKPGELFARREADKFSILLKYTTLEELCGRFDDFCNTVRFGGRTASEGNAVSSRKDAFILRPSVGICLVDNNENDIDKLQSCAMIARDTVKYRTDICYAFFDDKMRLSMLKSRQLADHMELGLLREDFEVYYQPKFDSMTREVVGAEALIRWRQPDGSFISPGEFIPLAEKNGLIGRLDRYMFRQVCRQQRRWLESGFKLVPISVNLSRSLLYDLELPAEYAREVDIHKIPAHLLQLEITEREDFEDLDIIAAAVEKLRQYGFCILLDDFGCGYSSLEILKELPVDVIKMDKKFIDAYSDVRGQTILKSTIALAKSLGIEIIAEGVETGAQVEFLNKCGCYRIQGYYYSRPLPGGEFIKLLWGSGCSGNIGGN